MHMQIKDRWKLCPSCNSKGLSFGARMRLGNIKCNNCGAEFRIAKHYELKIVYVIISQILFFWFGWIGLTTWNWWPMLILLCLSVISPVLVAVIGPVEKARRQKNNNGVRQHKF